MAYQEHSLSTQVMSDLKYLSDMLSANVSGRNTPLSQEGDDGQQRINGEDDDIIMNEVGGGNVKDLMEDGDVRGMVDGGALENGVNPPNLNNLRINGPDKSEIEEKFCSPLLDKYLKSKFYRTFIIAFEKGVLPKLSLQENQPCDPSYTKIYRDPRNNSVTWHFQKKFVFELYDKRDSGDPQLCDYRQGLVCSSQTKKCQCPEGSSMSPIDQGGSVKRCLLKQDEVCTLIDFAHSSDHHLLVENIYHLAFNLEKPPSCQPGTQCRFKEKEYDYSRCYSVGGGPFSSENFIRNLGQECAIGLLATPGSCDPQGGKGDFKDLTCYNYGPSRNPSHNEDTGRLGFCGPHFGPYGIAVKTQIVEGQYCYHPLFIPHVHPRTVPIRAELGGYYTNFLEQVAKEVSITSGSNKAMQRFEGAPCSVAKTEKFEKIWKYYASLEDTPAPGTDYVTEATKFLLGDNLEEMIDLAKAKNRKVKMCRVFAHYYGPDEFTDSLKCVQEGSPDSNGNDGKCRAPGNLNTSSFAKKFQTFLEEVSNIITELNNQEINYRDDILSENPEPPCVLELESKARELGTLEGGYCPEGSVCYDDFGDARGIFDSECNLKSEAKQRLVCHDLKQKLDKCEEEYLKKKILMNLKHLDKHAKRKKGQECDLEFEKRVREPEAKKLMENFNLYRVVNWLDRGYLCDMSKAKVMCGNKGICVECPGGKCEGSPGKKKSGGDKMGGATRGYWVLGVAGLIINWG